MGVYRNPRIAWLLQARAHNVDFYGLVGGPPGVASGDGTTIIDFGNAPGSNEASVTITGQTTISATSFAEAWIMSETSSNHTANDHRYGALFIAISCGAPTAGAGFTIYATSTEKMQGAFSVRWVWAD